ncbi:uroporphyrinogen-III synthase [Flavobacterium litorale]|uniref:Uroporphyrinogen-III synthase n=1 Tax=Flavobacterium litorale TaxID=2856519 RepID=A0ABX8V8G3_9FLAO|nr:uroporphyrinogen-III synthase [Flavobacterium litorale]QYJ69134.1 uroporphyrinogen-III synthase [Flavobacterium litorale]
MERSVRIVSTKKLQSNQRQYLLNAGLALTEANFISVKHKTFTTNDIRKNLIFTSQNGFKAFLANIPLGGAYKNHAIFCVGQKTRNVIVSEGYTVIAFSDYAEELAATIINNYNKERFTFLSGNIRRDTLPNALKNAGVDYNEIEVYKTALTPHKMNTEANGLLFFSPSGVASFLKQNTVGTATCFCIGTTTAEALTGITKKIIVANKPTIENVIIQCINYYKDNT